MQRCHTGLQVDCHQYDLMTYTAPKLVSINSLLGQPVEFKSLQDKACNDICYN